MRLCAWSLEKIDAGEDHAELVALQGRIAAELRDFARAEKLLDRAEALESKRPWIRLQRSILLEQQDHAR